MMRLVMRSVIFKLAKIVILFGLGFMLGYMYRSSHNHSISTTSPPLPTIMVTK